MKKNKIVVLAGMALLMVGTILNVHDALNEFGVMEISLHPQVMAQTGSTSGTTTNLGEQLDTRVECTKTTTTSSNSSDTSGTRTDTNINGGISAGNGIIGGSIGGGHSWGSSSSTGSSTNTTQNIKPQNIIAANSVIYKLAVLPIRAISNINIVKMLSSLNLKSMDLAYKSINQFCIV